LTLIDDPKEIPESGGTPPSPPLNETTPPMDLQQKGAESSDFETLEKTTPEMREFLGSQDRPRRNSSR